jgi:predicted PurR-regulated permease PerM
MSQATTPTQNYVRWMLIALGVIILSMFLWEIRNILLYVLTAVILDVFISIPVGNMMRMGIKRVPATIIAFIGAIIFMTLMVLMVFPTLIDQFILLGEAIGEGVGKAVDAWNSGELQEDLPFLKEISLIDLNEEVQLDVDTIRSVGDQVLDTLGELGGSVLPFLGGIANTVLSMLIILFLTIFFLVDPITYRNGFVLLFPKWYRHRIDHILGRLYTLLRRWIYAQGIGMLITGVGTFIGLRLIGIQQAAALAILTAFFSFVPNFGELLAAICSLAVGAVQAPDRLHWILIVIYGVSLIQGQILGPIITSERLKIPPVLILIGQIVVAGLFGVMGIILAVPITAIAMVIVQEVYIKDILGDRRDGEPVQSDHKVPSMADGVDDIAIDTV